MLFAAVSRIISTQGCAGYPVLIFSMQTKGLGSNGVKPVHLSVAIFYFFFVAGTFCLWGNPVDTTNSLGLTAAEEAWVKAAQPLAFGVDTSNPLLCFRDADGNLAGFYVDYLDLIAQKSGLKFKLWGSNNRATLVGRALERKLEGIVGVPLDEEQQDKLHLTTSYADIPFAVVTAKSAPAANSLHDFDGKRIAVVRSTSRSAIVKNVCGSAELIEVLSPSAGLQLIADGSADAFFDDLSTVQEAFKTANAEPLKIALLYSLPSAGAHYVALGNPSPELISILNKAIGAISAEEHLIIRHRSFPVAGKSTPLETGSILDEEEVAWFKAHPTIRVGIDLNRMPLEWRDSNGRYQGISIGYLRSVESILGVRFELVPGSRLELLEMAKKREVDVFFFMPATPERREYLSFTRPYLKLQNAVFSTEDVAYIHDLNQLNKKKVAVVETSAVRGYLTENWKDISQVVVGGTQEGIEAVRRGDAFAFIGVQLTTTHQLLATGKLDIRVVGNVDFSDEFCASVRSDWPELARVLDKSLNAIPEEDKIAYQKKWTSVGYAHGLEYTLLKWALGAGLLGLFFIVQLNIMVKRRTRELRQEVERRRQSEEALEHETARYRTLLATARDGVCVLNGDGYLLECNDTFLNTLGYTRDEVLGLHIGSWDVLHTREEIAAQMKNSNGKHLVFETQHRHKDGRVVDVEISAAAMIENGKKTAFCLVRDITERKRLQQQLMQSQKMESVGLLAGGIAHDFNNILSVILGRSELLQEEIPQDTPQREDIDEILAAAERAKDLTRQLLAFSRKQVLEVKTIDLGDVVHNMQKMIRRLLGEHITVAVLPPSGTHCVDADISQIEQVVMNLCVNARDAMPQGGTLSLEVDTVHLDTEDLVAHPGIQAGQYVMLSVSDTGMGMSEETRRHIFDPFFTTKKKGMGTGLGLAMVYGIVKQHGGGIWVYSEEGHGTIFKIYLPAVVDATPDMLPDVTETTSPGRGETVLVVEDDLPVRKLICQRLNRLGYVVLEAADVEESLRIARSDAKIDLLLTDVIMPGMNGREVWKKISEIRPEIRTLFMSGYTEDVIAHHGVLNPGIHFISKPFSELAFSRKIREVLDAS